MTREAQKNRQQRKLLRTIWKHRIFYLFVIPGVVWFIVFCYLPLYGLTLAFKDFSYAGGIFGGKYAGLTYFKQFFDYYLSTDIIRNTVVISFLKLIIGFPAPIILAIMLNEVKNHAFKRSLQTISYLPYFVSWVVVVTLLNRLLTTDGGPVNEMLHSLGLKPIMFMGNVDWFYPLIIGSFVWKTIGWNSIIYLAAIAGIDPELYEAAKIDGASRLRQMWHVTLPGIRDITIILFILGIGSLMSAGYEQMLLFKNPATEAIGSVLDTYSIEAGIKQGRLSYATAVGFFQSAIAFILILVVNRIGKKVSDVSLF
ncbi:sugar ABC transporter permease [Paenibacillus albus]|uniref:Sugar ABC transporter permease n=2 Tax=Paenibacillus albus TaxID=2495582 RepID=A0A3S9ADC7_9BACL|nr:sugar ABC transporter permease [Paenibacillus albus]